MQLGEDIPDREVRLEEAVNRVESHPDFPRVQVWMRNAVGSDESRNHLAPKCADEIGLSKQDRKLMQFTETTLHQDKRLEEACRLLESHPDFPRIQVLMRERLEEAERNAAAETRIYGNQKRLEYSLLRLDIRAEAYLPLVLNMSMQNAYVEHLLNWERMVWLEFTGELPELTSNLSTTFEKYFRSIHPRMEVWVKAGFQRLVNADQKPTSSPSDSMSNLSEPVVVAPLIPKTSARYPRTSLLATGWQEVEISLLSDFKLEIRIGRQVEVCNFADLGLEDRRSHKPNGVWLALRSLAELGGNIHTPDNHARTWPVMEKRIQRLRKFLQDYFNLPGDPLPFARGNGYQARFTIRLGRSYDK